MYFLWRTIRFFTITGALLYSFVSLTPHVFNLGDWLGKHFQTDGQQASAPAELLGAADQPRSIKEYYIDAH